MSDALLTRVLKTIVVLRCWVLMGSQEQSKLREHHFTYIQKGITMLNLPHQSLNKMMLVHLA